MRKIMCLAVAMLLILAVPVCAAANTFVPSIGYKDGPEIEDAKLNDENVEDCLVVSSILDCRDKTTDIGQDDRDLLLEVYKKLQDGTMELPLDDDYVIRELVDVSFHEEDCVPKHEHEEELKKGDVTLEVVFDLGVAPGTDLIVMVYVDGEWKRVEDVTIRSGGSVVCVFEEICPVVFCVDPESVNEPPKTGDTMGAGLILWIVLLAASVAAAVVLMRFRRRIVR